MEILDKFAEPLSDEQLPELYAQALESTIQHHGDMDYRLIGYALHDAMEDRQLDPMSIIRASDERWEATCQQRRTTR
jgi:hypothetical protein